MSDDQTPFAGTFAEMDLPEGIHKGLVEMGYTAPTKVQSSVYHPLRAGKNVVVQSRTGSGKTTAFCLPTLVGIDPSLNKVQAIGLCPTRELASQVATEASRLSRFADIKVAAIYGGASIRGQIDSLEKGVHFVVGTPGRVLDLIRRGHLKLGNVKFAVLDEADEMLSMGFWDEVTSILDQLPQERQTLLFSATLPPQIERAAARYLTDPERIDLSTDNVNVSTIDHIYIKVDERLPKPRNFLYMLEFYKPKNAIIFCNRRDETELLSTFLTRWGFRAQALNGDMSQSAREKVLKKVKAGELDFMIATDVAARGIDINDLAHVFNYDLPDFDEVYVHRSGRTGRIGKRGTCVSMVRGKYETHLTTLEKDFEVPFTEKVLPSEKEILWMQAERLAEQLLEDADGVEIGQYRPVAESMVERGDVKELIAFLLRSHFSKKVAPKTSSDDSRSRGDRDRSRGRRDEKRPRRDRDERPRDDKREARDDKRDEAPAENESVANLYVSLGTLDDVADLTALCAKINEMTGVDLGHFTGGGQVREHSSHVEVDIEVAEKVIAGLHGKVRPYQAPPREGEEVAEGEEAEDKGPQTIVCEKARPKRRRPRRSRR